jgi:GTP-binding protein Era
LECKDGGFFLENNYLCKKYFSVELEIQNIPIQNPKHRAGFVSIIGRPNVGKSTLMNALVGAKLSIITSKAQTTRHRIMGMLNGNHNGTPFQLVYSDTPGVLKPVYRLHESMMTFVKGSLEDADVVLFVTEVGEKIENHEVIELLTRTDAPVVLVLNKTDLATPEQIAERTLTWNEALHLEKVVPISALKNTNIDGLFDEIINLLPLHPPYFDSEELTDKPERFFAAEMIREKIFLNYKQEIPYSSEVVVMDFKEKKDIIVIRAEIWVERPTQKSILIGENGKMLKKVGTEARIDMEAFFGKKVFLEQFVKVEPDWRNKVHRLKAFGYEE